MPRIKLLSVGATLTSRGKDSLDLARYGKDYSGMPPLSPAQLLDNVPEMSRFAQVEPDLDLGNQPVALKPPVMWQELATRLQQLFDEEPDLDGAVVVHGTNVLEETAYMLNLVLKTEKPVVVVGAQRPFTAISSDGPINLANAVRVAASPEAKGRGVLVVLNDQIHSARDVSKTSTYRLETFQAPALGPLGFADADRVVFYHRSEKLHTYQTTFVVSDLAACPRVDVLYDYVGADGGLVEASVALGARGIVVAGAGAGALGGMKEALQAAAAEGLIVVRSSRVGSGRVVAEDNYAITDSVAADNLNPQKARVLLQLALTKSSVPAEIQRLFDTH